VVATKKTNNNLPALMAAALALPGMGAYAGDPNVRVDSVGYSYNHATYTESDNRMAVKTDQLSLTIPIADRYEIKFNAINDVTTGASPSINLPINGKTVIKVDSAASIRDNRRVFDVSANYYGDAHFAGINIGHSVENDYISNFISGNYRRFFNDKATTLDLGVAVANDSSWEVFYPLNFFSQHVESAPRRKNDLLVGISQIMDANTVLQFSLGYSYSYGALNEHYRAVLLLPQYVGLEDARPDNRTQWTALMRYSHYLAGTQSALHLDYRYAQDSWGADSHTLDGKWRFDVGDGWSLSPGLRYYTQKNAFFYQTLYFAKPADGYASADYRLAGFGAISPKLEVIKEMKNGVSIRASYENYMRRKSYMTGDARGDAIDDYNAKTLSVSIEGVF
jgi:hypothetical protein